MRYAVLLGYKKFIFTDSDQAVKFAETAKSTYKPNSSHDDEELEVTIEIYNKEDE